MGPRPGVHRSGRPGPDRPLDGRRWPSCDPARGSDRRRAGTPLHHLRSRLRPAELAALPTSSRSPRGWSQVRTADGGCARRARRRRPNWILPRTRRRSPGRRMARHRLPQDDRSRFGHRPRLPPEIPPRRRRGPVRARGRDRRRRCGPRMATADTPVRSHSRRRVRGRRCVVNRSSEWRGERDGKDGLERGRSDRDGRDARIGIDLGGGRRLRHATAELVERPRPRRIDPPVVRSSRCSIEVDDGSRHGGGDETTLTQPQRIGQVNEEYRRLSCR